LIRTMTPLIILMMFIATGAFFFQNNVLPIAQTKMWTLLYSARQKSPELEIPEGVFYDQIPGYNLFVQEKNRDTGVLYDMMIYDVSRGFENSSIILADSGKMTITPDKTHLFLRLWQGESFENLKDAASGMKNVPYRRESFDTKEIMLKFDANFNRMDEQGMRNQYVGKNMAELQATIDSVGERVDSLGGVYAKDLREKPVLNISPYKIRYVDGNPVKELRRPVAITTTLDIDSVFRGPSSGFALNYLNQALTKVQRQRQEYEFTALSMADDMKTIRRHAIELQKKFTLSFACIIFFFIGAPLGAIIRKGGLGTPLVISVLLFIFYYIIDNMGYKFARDGKLPVWQGMWLSAAVLLPLGIFFTYKAVNDSVVFNKDAYVNFFRRFFGVSETRKVEMKEVVMEEVRPDVAIERLATLRKMVAAYLAANPAKESYIKYWTTGYDRDSLMSLRDEMEEIIDRLSNSRDKMVIMKLMDYPVLRWLWFIRPAAKRWLGLTLAALFPIGIPVWIAGRSSQARLRHELETVDSVSSQITTLIENGKDKA
ncbi:MAG: LptF/LptG family permease, partial [Duncaniella sp.]|nr:LptF/LptG family permease [Duncaniella sp.]